MRDEVTGPALSPAPVDGQGHAVGDDRQTYTLAEAARRLGISRTLAYEAASRGELPVCRIGRRLLVPRAALARLLSETPSARPA
jgi:excisionase family DNA binding protein